MPAPTNRPLDRWRFAGLNPIGAIRDWESRSDPEAPRRRLLGAKTRLAVASRTPTWSEPVAQLESATVSRARKRGRSDQDLGAKGA
jgi:hypothetical protein